MRKRSKPSVGQIGSISSGTLNPTDLFSAYLWEAERLKLTREERNVVRKNAARRLSGDEPDFDECLAADIEELAAILEAHSPEGCYFGAAEGDGADIGWWPAWDSIEEDSLKVGDLAEVPKGHTGNVLLVSDHGNAALYSYQRGRGRELWALV